MPNFGLPSAGAEASRRNGAKSRGPKSPEGKARSAQNALKHGLRARKWVVLHGESAAEFERLEAALIEELAPEGVLQSLLAQRVAAAVWRLGRAEQLETQLFAENGLTGRSFGLALIRDCNGARSFDTLLRYRGGTLAELWRALRTLKALQAEAAAQMAERIVAAEAPAPAPALAAVTPAQAPALAAQPDEPERRANPCDSGRARNPAARNAEPSPDPVRRPLPLPAPGPVGERGPKPFLARAPRGRAMPIEPENRRNLGGSALKPAGESAKNGSASLLAGTALVPARRRRA
jgi:hypothetical protein